MIELGQQAAFQTKLPQSLRRLQIQIFFDGYLPPVELQILRQPDAPKAPLAEWPEKAIALVDGAHTLHFSMNDLLIAKFRAKSVLITHIWLALWLKMVEWKYSRL